MADCRALLRHARPCVSGRTAGSVLALLGAGISAGQAPSLAVSSLAAAPPAPAALGGEGTAAPLLTSFLSVSAAGAVGTELVIELSGGEGTIEPGVPSVGAEVWLVALAPSAECGDGAVPDLTALRGARLLQKVEVAQGSAFRSPVPSALFGTDLTIGALLVGADELAFAAVALPPEDPAEPLLVPPPERSLVVNEFMKDPAAVSDVRGEWLELVNLTDEPINIEGWTLRDDGSNRTVLTAGGAGIIAWPGVPLVLGRNASPSENGGIAVDATYAGFTLANGADQIVLEAPGGFLVDRVDYLDGGAGGWPDESGASISLSPRFQGTPAAVDGSSWCAGAVALPSGDRGTPGAANPDC
ncbi:MAG: lamin tail domain-containing protein [Planctomycetota bacterium]